MSNTPHLSPSITHLNSPGKPCNDHQRHCRQGEPLRPRMPKVCFHFFQSLTLVDSSSFSVSPQLPRPSLHTSEHTRRAATSKKTTLSSSAIPSQAPLPTTTFSPLSSRARAAILTISNTGSPILERELPYGILVAPPVCPVLFHGPAFVCVTM